ncbi:hypothetical protein [Castellaniella sp.]|uniref:hypothetical protein n=1 Tax=Castellaniella sp. TaxID=1955812 RepID=UPI002AFEDBCC|nr:hypothetical protein [Castellaniella sp.]
MSLDLKLDQPAGQALLRIEQLVREQLDKNLVDLQAQEEPIDFGCDSESEQGYVSWWFAADPDDPGLSVRIEIGVHDGEEHHPVAGFKALWNRAGGMGQVQSIVLEGRQCGPVPFLRRLEGVLAETGMRAVVAR